MATLVIVTLLVVLLIAAWLSGQRALQDSIDRGAWIALTIAVVLWMTGMLSRVVFWGVSERPSPAIPDLFFLAFFPVALLGMALMIRPRLQGMTWGIFIDALIVAMSAAAIGTAVIVPTLDITPDSTAIQTALLFAYPTGDLVLLGTVSAVIVALRYRTSGPWFPIAIGLVLVCVADILWAVFSAEGVTILAELSAIWIPGFLAIAYATYRYDPGTQVLSARGWAQLIVPIAGASAALLLLAIDTLVTEVPLSTVLLSIAVIILSLVRMAFVFHENIGLLGARELAMTDPLTGLGNRRLLESSFARADDLWHDREIGCGLLIIDLDHFKDLNVAVGHAAGDRILKLLATRLTEALGDDHVVARMGGDEFAIFVSDSPTEEDLQRIARRARTTIERPIEEDGLRLRMQSKVGAALMPESTAEANDLLRCADMAVYEAKRARSDFEIYNRERDGVSRDRLGLAAELRDAIGNNELLLHYQPKLRLRSGSVDEVEALVRWRHPRMGLLMPDEFLPIAEQVGLMQTITSFVLLEALTQTGRWHAEGRRLGVAVNLSVGDVRDVELPNRVRSALSSAGLPGEVLTLELTEDMVVDESDSVNEILGRLSDMDVRLALDDFGAGASSLAYMHRLPLKQLKLDRSFALQVATDPNEAMVVSSTIELCRELGLETVAEGVESRDALSLLESFGCDYVQAWMIATPKPADELAQWLDERVVAQA